MSDNLRFLKIIKNNLQANLYGPEEKIGTDN